MIEIQLGFNQMICENCGARIDKGESQCPKCGMELFNPNHKPLQKKYLRGEYLQGDESSPEPYYLEEENLSRDTYQPEPYQNWDDYDKDPHEENHQKKDYEGVNDPETAYDNEFEPNNNPNPNVADINHNQDISRDTNHSKHYSERSYNKKYDRERGYDNKYGKSKGYKGKFNQENYHQKNKSVRRGYDLDAYYGSEGKKSSILTTAILFLVLALIIGFVMGFIFFSGKIQNLLT